MAHNNTNSVYALTNSGTLAHPVFSITGAAVATNASIIDDNSSANTSTAILGDTAADSFSIVGYDSPDTQGGNSDELSDAYSANSGGDTIDPTAEPLVYKGYLTSSFNGVTYHGAVGYDTNTGNYFAFFKSGTPDAAVTNAHFSFTKNVVGTNSTEWVISSESPYCFVAGTLLSTPSGERAVETLRAGDLVLTAAGVAKPVRWIGETIVATAFADKLTLLPVRIAAGALADNVPSRDLLVSPGHAVQVGDLLVHASALVNGATVTRETAMPAVFSYYHVETDSHDLLLAENTPCESFLEAVADIRMDNFPERAALAGEGAVVEMSLPRVKAARQLPADLRAAIEARAGLVEVRAAA